MKYFVVRVFFNQKGTQSNSIQYYTELNAAKKRFYSIVATDIDNTDISYELIQIVNGDGITIENMVIENPAESEAE